MATYRADITKSIEPAMANPALLGQAAKAKAGGITTLAGLAEDVYKGYVAGEIAKVEEEAAATAGEFFISGQAASEAARRASAVQTARGTLFRQFDESAPLEQQEAVGKQLGAFDNELRRLKDAVEGGMSNERYVSRIDSITKTAIAKFPGLANQIRERVAAVTGMPGADRWAQMSYVRDRFTPPKEGKQPKSAEDVALQDMDKAADLGVVGTREELLNLYRTNRVEYDRRMSGAQQIMATSTEAKRVKAYIETQREQSDVQADQQRPAFAVIFRDSLGTSVLTQAVQEKETTFAKTLELMAAGDPRAVNASQFDTLIKLHSAQMRTNIDQARSQAKAAVDTYIQNNSAFLSSTKRNELYADIDRMAETALTKYADDKGIGLTAMATIMRTYRDKTLQEKQILVDLAIKQQTAMQNNPMVMQYWAGGEARENLKRTNRSFYEFMVGQEKELVESIGGLRSDIKGASSLANVQRHMLQAEQSPDAVPRDSVAPPQDVRAAHEAHMATAIQILQKSELLPPEVNIVSSALSTSSKFGGQSELVASRYRVLGDKILKLPEPQQAVIKSSVSKTLTQSVRDVIDLKQVIEDKYKTKLQLGVNDAGEIGVVAPATTLSNRPLVGGEGFNPAAASEFMNQLKPRLNNMVFFRAMLTKEDPKAVGQDFATLINNGQSYGGFFSMEARPVTPAATPAAPAATPAAPAASAAKPATGGTLKVGDVVNGFTYNGGDPNAETSWSKK